MGYVPNDLTDLANYPNVDPTRIYQDIIALDNLLSGNLTQDNMSPDMRLPLVNLATPNAEQNWNFPLFIQAALTTGQKTGLKLSSSALYSVVSGAALWNGTGGTPAAGNSWTLLYGQYAASGFVSAGMVASGTYFGVGASAGELGFTPLVSTIQGPTSLVLNISQVTTPPTGGHLSVTLQGYRNLR